VGVVGFLARGEMRRRWRSVVALTLLVGAVGAIVLATVAGARRSDNAMPRFNAASNSADLEITVGKQPKSKLDAFARLPDVQAVGIVRASMISVPKYQNLAIGAPIDARFGSDVDRARVIAGRAANPRAADEVTIGEHLAAQLHLHVGDHLDAVSYTPAQAARALATGDPGPKPLGPALRLLVVGIVRRPLDLGNRGAAGGVSVISLGFDRKYAGRIGDFGLSMRVRTVHAAADVPAVAAAARRMFGDAPNFDTSGVAGESAGASDAISVLSAALWIFAGVTAVAGAVAITIVLSREISLAGVEQSTLRSLGLTRPERVAASLLPAVLIGAGGAALAVIGAAAASPLFPLGVARRADPDVGVHFDSTVLLLGFGIVVLMVLAIAGFTALRVARETTRDATTRQRRRPSVVAERAARVGLAPPATNGLCMALEPGRGRTAVPVRSALLGAVFGVLGITAVFTFALSLDHLVRTPRLFGWTWDFTAQGRDGVCGSGASIVPERALEGVGLACYTNTEVDGRPTIVWGFNSVRGGVEPEVVAGRPARTDREITLGTATLRGLHKHIGDSVRVVVPAGSRSYKIVGRVVLPTFRDPQPLSDGAMLTISAFNRVVGPPGTMTSQYWLGRFKPGISRARRAALVRSIPAIPSNPALGPVIPPEVDRLRQIDWFPTTLAALLGVLAMLAVGHSLVTAVRRRGRELALLKTLGFSRRQVRATVAWSATTLGFIGLVLGLPLGVIVGKVIWARVADGLGVATGATIPALAGALVVIGVLVLVNLIAFVPARRAADTRAAVALRAE
jgi:ABC-type lipoprotein release transport system permease subunit